ncbi:MAG TPA: pilus assembly protein [Anaerolineae bacterium]|nr:pilus assembly protein [Anaerolineae bacterium]
MAEGGRKRNSRTEISKDLGQSLVELALILPVLMLILMGIVDFGRAFNARIIITNAAREGARYGAMHPADEGGIKDRVINEAAGSGISIEADDVEVEFPNGTSEPGNPIRVTVTYDFSLITPFLFGGDTTIRSSVEMVIF